MTQAWTLADMPDLTDQVAVVTGANSGIGLYAAEALARAGAEVVMACRNLERSQQAHDAVSRAGRAQLLKLDVSDLNSVSAFADRLRGVVDRVDILVNNAGIMGGPRQTSAQGFELQMATNYLGHFALTSHLWDLLIAHGGARVVSTSSLAARSGTLRRGMKRATIVDPSPYFGFAVYCNTKQATLLFSQELTRRATIADVPIVSVAAHPGVSASNLFNRSLSDMRMGFLTPVTDRFGKLVLQSAEAGALPSIRAAVDPAIPTGAFVGPDGLAQYRGAPVIVPLFRSGADQATAMQLWEISEHVTGRELLTGI